MFAHRFPASQYSQVVHLEWPRDATIYKINTRQYSATADFSAVERDLQRIKNLGVDIIWLMPIHPTGVQARKGILVSSDTVKDYPGGVISSLAMKLIFANAKMVAMSWP